MALNFGESLSTVYLIQISNLHVYCPSIPHSPLSGFAVWKWGQILILRHQLLFSFYFSFHLSLQSLLYFSCLLAHRIRLRNWSVSSICSPRNQSISYMIVISPIDPKLWRRRSSSPTWSILLEFHSKSLDIMLDTIRFNTRMLLGAVTEKNPKSSSLFVIIIIIFFNVWLLIFHFPLLLLFRGASLLSLSYF